MALTDDAVAGVEHLENSGEGDALGLVDYRLDDVLAIIKWMVIDAVGSVGGACHLVKY